MAAWAFVGLTTSQLAKFLWFQDTSNWCGYPCGGRPPLGNVLQCIVQIMSCCTRPTRTTLRVLIVDTSAVQEREWVDRRIAPTCGDYYFWNKPHTKSLPEGVIIINHGWICNGELTNVICHFPCTHRHLCIDTDEIDAQWRIASAQSLKLWLIVVTNWAVCGNE